MLGKPPGASSILPEVMSRLRQRGFEVAVHLPHEAAEPVPTWLFDADLVMQRGLDLNAMAAIRRLERCGVRCCNPVDATIAARDRLVVSRRLTAARLPVPATTAAPMWEDVLAAQDRPVVVKARDAGRGRGATVLVAPEGALPPSASFEGPYVVQDFVPGDGWDRKLYFAGHDVRGLLKPSSPTTASAQPLGPPFLTPSLIDLGLRVGLALGLEIYGVDLVGASAGPRIIDVNPFPGFRGIPQGARLLAHHISTLALAP